MTEISAENLAQIEKRYRTTAFIVLAQIFVTFVLIALAWLIASTGSVDVSSPPVTTLWVAIVFIAIGSFMLRRLFFGWERLKNIYLLRGLPGLLGTLQFNSIILGAMAEVIAVIGLVIVVYTGTSSDMLRAGAIALIIFLVNFPRKNSWKNVVANLEKV